MLDVLKEKARDLVLLLHSQKDAMADPKWQTHLRPLFDEVVNLMSNLALSDIADKMVSKNLLELEQFERLDDTLESGQSKKAARRLLINLMKLPEPSFNTFCDILRGFESAEDLLRLVEPVKEQLRKEEVSSEIFRL